MWNVLISKKLIVSVIGLISVFVLALAGRDLELIKWVGGFIAGIVSAFNVAQGFADGVSRGKTSANQSAARDNATGTQDPG